MNKSINKLHKRILNIRFRSSGSTIDELLLIDGSQCIHVRNLQVLMTEIYKTINDLNPPFMKDIFQIKHVDYNLRNNNLLKIPKTYTQSYGQKSIALMGAIVWNHLPPEFKDAKNVETFKIHIKQWDAKTCKCNICI